MSDEQPLLRKNLLLLFCKNFLRNKKLLREGFRTIRSRFLRSPKRRHPRFDLNGHVAMLYFAFAGVNRLSSIDTAAPASDRRELRAEQADSWRQSLPREA